MTMGIQHPYNIINYRKSKSPHRKERETEIQKAIFPYLSKACPRFKHKSEYTLFVFETR